MNTTLKTACFFACALGLAGSGSLRAELHFKAAVVEAGTTLLNLSLSDGYCKWCTLGDVVEGYKLQSLSADGNELTLAKDGTPALILKMDKAKVRLAVGEDGLVPLDQLDWKYIKSQDNPMKTSPENLPMWALLNWAKLPLDVQLDFRNYFREHGWDFTVAAKGKGGVWVSNVRLKDPSVPQPTFEELKAKGLLAPAGGLPAKN